MTTLTITRGLPASGKTTYARNWVAADPAGRARINRDDIRGMAHASVFLGQDTEKQIQVIRDAAVGALLKRGVDVIVDDTNLPSRTARDLRRLAMLAGADFRVWDLTNVPLQVCLDRNAAREGVARVPEDRIRDMRQRYIAGRPYPLPLAEETDAVDEAPEPYVPHAGAPKAVLVDLDGTVALMCGRSPYDETRVQEDRPNRAVVQTVRAMHAAGHAVIFCSGRTEACRAATEKWLAEHVAVPYAALWMRPVGDMRKDAVVKRELFDNHIRRNWDVVCVLDDRQQVVDMWRSLGLTVFQVAPGDF